MFIWFTSTTNRYEFFINTINWNVKIALSSLPCTTMIFILIDVIITRQTAAQQAATTNEMAAEQRWSYVVGHI